MNILLLAWIVIGRRTREGEDRREGNGTCMWLGELGAIKEIPTGPLPGGRMGETKRPRDLKFAGCATAIARGKKRCEEMWTEFHAQNHA